MTNKQAETVPSQKEKLQLILRSEILEGNQCSQKFFTTASLASRFEWGAQVQVRLRQSTKSFSFTLNGKFVIFFDFFARVDNEVSIGSKR